MALNGEDGKKIREAIERFGTNLKKDISVRAPFDKTKNGRITKVSPTGYTVEIENKEYTNVKAINANVLAENDIVVCKLPNNQMSQMYIIGKLVGQVEADGNGGKVKDVQINGTSIVVDHIANILVDSSPTQNSTHLITSSGVYNATFSRVYRSIAEVSGSLTSSSTMIDLINAMANNSVLVCQPGSYTGLIPSNADNRGVLEVYRTNNENRANARYTVGSTTDSKMWYGEYHTASSTNYWTWREVANVNNLSNPNLLYNSDFFVNNSTVTSWTAIGSTPCIDGWNCAEATVSVSYTTEAEYNKKGLKVVGTGNSRIFQNIKDHTYLWGKTLTISACIDGVIYTYTGTMPTTIPTSNSGQVISSGYNADGYRLRIGYYPSEDRMSVLIDCNVSRTYYHNWVKLELGDIATKYFPPIYEIEQGALYAYNNAIDITGLTVDLNSLTFSSGYPYYRRYICKTTEGSSNISNKPTGDAAFILDVDLIRYVSANNYLVRQTSTCVSNIDIIFVRTCSNGTWGSWSVSPYRRIVPMCNSSGGSTNKVVSQPAYTAQEGNLISVYFLSSNTAANATLNINSTGAYPIYVDGSPVTSSNLKAGWHTFYFDGSHYLTGTHSLPTESVNAVAWTDVNTTFPLSSASASDSKILSEKAVYTEVVALEDKISKCAHLNGSWTQIKQYNQAFTSGFTLGIGTYEFYLSCPMYSANGYAWQYGTMTVWDLNIAADILSTRFNLFNTAAYDIFICRDTSGKLSIVDKYGTNNDAQNILVYYRKL